MTLINETKNNTTGREVGFLNGRISESPRRNFETINDRVLYLKARNL